MKHKVDVLLHALEEVSWQLDNSTISSLASFVALICTMGSDESHDPPPKPSVVFTTDELKNSMAINLPPQSHRRHQFQLASLITSRQMTVLTPQETRMALGFLQAKSTQWQ